MKIFKSILFFTLILCVGSSCKKFLEVQPKGIIIAQTVGDFEALLNNDRNMMNPFGTSNSIINVTDDINQPNFSIQNVTVASGNIYFWREYINNSTDKAPDVWAEFYNVIANLNAITEGVLTASGDTEQKRKQIYAEAMVNKSFIYLQLLSFFSPAYDKATASSNYGVPYITSTDVSQPHPIRPSLQESYDHLIADIVNSLPNLPEQNINNARVTKNAAYGLLSRIYMSMGDFANAEKYADLVLNSGGARILNYSDYIGGRLPMTNISPEELFVRYSNNLQFLYSKDLLSNYEVDKDLRLQFFANRQDDGNYLFYGNYYNPNRGITYAEIYLNKAECLARNGKTIDALNIVNQTIRKNRFAPQNYSPLSASTQAEAITTVLKERRRELAFKGVRWNDMKRLDKENRMPPVQRFARDGETLLETLAPGSTAYTFQIPLTVQFFNPKMPLNKR